MVLDLSLQGNKELRLGTKLNPDNNTGAWERFPKLQEPIKFTLIAAW